MTEALSRVRGEAHEGRSIAWRQMLQAFFHAWERRLASVTTDRVVRPFEWGLDWMPPNGRRDGAPDDALRGWVSDVMADTDAFFTPPPTTDYGFDVAADGTG